MFNSAHQLPVPQPTPEGIPLLQRHPRNLQSEKSDWQIQPEQENKEREEEKMHGGSAG